MFESLQTQQFCNLANVPMVRVGAVSTLPREAFDQAGSIANLHVVAEDARVSPNF